ncbi:SRPBCC family protein [Ilumatobacter coccineus]|jgi:uncharacterized protein YndB with AHSA1/START domain|uniref:Polyketide cyclase n=1 Tax=Ilumatobacter coccineus (strain NBRC 103263 / KCTC 29153 / YM16-304) TaxID=1313172 RepID=A0A6C7E519_ILUCY|nr:SRPBCC family protein [Ilumatobacter coccineus]BAN01670.1 hypothetical protein YM304_13560 [Ilumatobacter coccineus YM16-304]
MPKLTVHPPEWIDSAPAVAESSVAIDAPPAAVWARIADHESWPEWFTDLKKVERVGTGVGVGSGRKVGIALITIDEEFTAWTENEHFAFAVTKTPVPVLTALVESVRIEETEAGCTVTYRQGVAGRTGFGWLAKRIAAQLQGQTGDALQNLKRLVEA